MLCGIDEAGRGCCAGPLVVAGVVLKNEILGLKDSKKLSESKREELSKIIKQNALYKVVFCSNKLIDDKGLSYCLNYAIKTIKEHFSECEILMDGNCSFGVDGVKTLIKADTKIPEVSAASILAKVSRDNFMYTIAKEFKHYGFEKHKGYVTPQHVEMIKKYGLSPIHRKSYKIKNLNRTLF